MRGGIMVIDKTKYNSTTGFEPGVLYCFNNNLKGEYCNHCKYVFNGFHMFNSF